MTHDEPAQPTRNLPMRWRLWFTAGVVLALYALYVGMHWAGPVKTIPTGLSALAIIVVSTLILGGCVDVALTRMDALDETFAELRAKVDSLTAFGHLADTVAANSIVLRQLSAARTVDLHKLRQAEERMEGLVRTLTVEAIEDLRKEIRSQGDMFAERLGGVDRKLSVVEELMERFKDLEADLASFRLWQKRSELTASANGKTVALRSVPKQSE